MMKASDIQVGGSHYKDMVIQPYQFALANQLDYCQANVIKYVCRHASKNGLQDLEKAKHYIDLMIEHYYQNQSSEVPKATLEAEKYQPNYAGPVHD
ncbi:DUF3310 domain-containing protein [Acinetobacter sp. YH16038]|uniref:DUF3310 domain-containing protein n=1 Tax=Acinetobacter sp. YH16038 TaxID=2601183 RepID=UPI0015D2B1EA|nr:DUF3310 domain-containing protein [Acinetobacter sp. YH16038]